MKRVELSTAALMMLLAVVVFFGTSELPIWEEDVPGSRFMPVWVAAASAVLAVFLFQEARTKPASGEPADWPDRRGAVRVLLGATAILGFVALSPTLGFVVTTGLLVVFMLMVVERRPVLPSLAAGFITASLVQGVFVWWLSVSLPHGILGI